MYIILRTWESKEISLASSFILLVPEGIAGYKLLGRGLTVILLSMGCEIIVGHCLLEKKMDVSHALYWLNVCYDRYKVTHTLKYY